MHTCLIAATCYSAIIVLIVTLEDFKDGNWKYGTKSSAMNPWEYSHVTSTTETSMPWR